ncbi:MAG: hypothetical protein J5379_04430 [Clostridiales bacterium]|nr:hypothetical protein [Clostridiales bacterium]
MSQNCPGCGFPRISKANRPDFIIPFKISKEDAIRQFQESVGNGFFVSKSFKEIDPECVRGIYLPADLYSGDFAGAQERYDSEKEINVQRVGKCQFVSLPVFSCSMMPEALSLALEPYYFAQAEEFNSSYLMGFYADIADIPSEDTIVTAKEKAAKMFISRLWDENLEIADPEEFLRPVPKFKSENSLEKVGSAMLPVWFITVRYEGRPHTFLINGQTGKVAGTAPWNKARFWGLFALCCLLYTLIIVACIAVILSGEDAASDPDAVFNAIFMLAGGAVAAYRARKALVDFNEHASHTYRSDTFIFVKKRQGDQK